METTTDYLIVGGGMTADAACKGIRDIDPDGKIVLVGDEPHPPYAGRRSRRRSGRATTRDTVWRGTADLGVDLRLGRRIVALDLERRTARDDQGETLRLRAAAARDRRAAAAAAVRRRRGRSISGHSTTIGACARSPMRARASS